MLRRSPHSNGAAHIAGALTDRRLTRQLAPHGIVAESDGGDRYEFYDASSGDVVNLAAREDVPLKLREEAQQFYGRLNPFDEAPPVSRRDAGHGVVVYAIARVRMPQTRTRRTRARAHRSAPSRRASGTRAGPDSEPGEPGEGEPPSCCASGRSERG